MPHETFAKFRTRNTIELVMLRNLLQREIRRRFDLALDRHPHEATFAPFKALQGGIVERREASVGDAEGPVPKEDGA